MLSTYIEYSMALGTESRRMEKNSLKISRGGLFEYLCRQSIPVILRRTERVQYSYENGAHSLSVDQHLAIRPIFACVIDRVLPGPPSNAHPQFILDS